MWGPDAAANRISTFVRIREVFQIFQGFPAGANVTILSSLKSVIIFTKLSTILRWAASVILTEFFNLCILLRPIDAAKCQLPPQCGNSQMKTMLGQR